MPASLPHDIMNILFYVEPWVEKNWPAWRDLWLSMVHAPLCRGLAQLPDVHCFFVTGSAQTAALRQFDGWLDYRSAALTPEELAPLFPDALTAMLAWNNGTASTAQTAGMIALLKAKLNGFVPDIIINYFTPAPFLTQAFPQALVLHEDYAAFSRPPFPVAFSFDPCGLMRHGFLARHAATLRQHAVQADGRQFLATLRQYYGEDILRQRNPFTRAQLTGDRPFHHLILLPLQVGQSFAFEGQGSFTSQLDMLTQVLNAVPHTIGVVVTEHSDWERSLTPEILADLRLRYPHFLYHAAFDDILYPAQFLLPLVDGVATLSSSVGLQALLWNKPVCALGQSQINSVPGGATLEQLPDLLAQGLSAEQRDAQDALLYFLFTRFIVPVSADYLQNPVWLYDRLTQWLTHYRRGIDADFFPLIDTLPRLLQHYIHHSDRNVPRKRAAA